MKITLSVTFTGELDLTQAGKINRIMEAAADSCGRIADRIVLDLSGVTFCDVAATRTLFHWIAKLAGDLTVIDPDVLVWDLWRGRGIGQ